MKCNNQRWRRYSNFLISQNRWLAMRYGMERGLIDFGRREMVPYPELLEELLENIQPDAERFGCVDEVAHARTIVQRGTSADRQRATYAAARAAGADEAGCARRRSRLAAQGDARFLTQRARTWMVSPIVFMISRRRS